MVEVPDVSDLRPRDAFAVLRDAGLEPAVLGMLSTWSDGDFRYSVAAQEPVAGAQVEPGTTVLLALEPQLLSFGGGLEQRPRAPRGSPAPDVIGLELEEAMQKVADAGFIAVTFQPKRAVRTLTVSRQEPPAGTPMELWQVGIHLD